MLGVWRTPSLRSPSSGGWHRPAYITLVAIEALAVYISIIQSWETLIVQELCESRGGRPGLSVLTSLMVSVDVKQY